MLSDVIWRDYMNRIVKYAAAGIMALTVALSAAACSGTGSSSPGEQEKTISYDSIPVNSRTKDKVGFQLDKPEAGDEIAVITVKGYGTMKMRLFPDSAPKTVENFKALVNSGFYNGKTFYEAEKDVKILAGDPKEDKSANGQPIEDEFNANLLNLSGAVSMYNEGSNTTASRFFINTVSAEFFKSTTTRTSLRYSLDGYIKALGEYEAEYKEKYGDEWETYAAKDMPGSAADPRKINDETFNLYLQHGGNITYDGELAVYNKGYNVFGQIFEGYDIAEKISNVAVDDSKKPTQDIVIEKIEIVKYN